MASVTQRDISNAAKRRNEALRYARTYKERAKMSAWDLRPVDYAALIADQVQTARFWHRKWREFRAAAERSA